MDVWEPGSYLTLQPHLCCVCACPAQWASSHPLQTAVAQQPSPHQNSCTPTRCAWFILAPLPPPQTLGSAAWLASADLSSVQQLESLQKGLTELNRSQSARQGPARGGIWREITSPWSMSRGSGSPQQASSIGSPPDGLGLEACKRLHWGLCVCVCVCVLGLLAVTPAVCAYIESCEGQLLYNVIPDFKLLHLCFILREFA